GRADRVVVEQLQNHIGRMRISSQKLIRGWRSPRGRTAAHPVDRGWSDPGCSGLASQPYAVLELQGRWEPQGMDCNRVFGDGHPKRIGGYHRRVRMVFEEREAALTLKKQVQ